MQKDFRLYLYLFLA